MTKIMDQMSCYTARTVKWDWLMKKSQLDLSPPKYEFGELKVQPVATPGFIRLCSCIYPAEKC